MSTSPTTEQIERYSRQIMIPDLGDQRCITWSIILYRRVYMKTRLTHVRINVSDINRALKWYEEPLFDTPWRTRKFTIKDLDGNELGFGG